MSKLLYINIFVEWNTRLGLKDEECERAQDCSNMHTIRMVYSEKVEFWNNYSENYWWRILK